MIRVIHEGFVDLSIHDAEKRDELHDYLMASSEKWLQELVAPLDWVAVRLTHEVIWFKSEWQAILSATEAFNADLIIKAAHSREGAVIRTPQDWHLLRHSAMPVMLVKPLVWHDQPVVLAALDIESEDQAELNARILRRGADPIRYQGKKVPEIKVPD